MENNWFLPVIEQKNVFFIPILGTKFTCQIKWLEDETFPDLGFNNYCSLRSNLCFDENYDIDNGLFQILHVYEVICRASKDKYYLISFSEIQEHDDMYDTVCVPYNKLNILKFYKDYVMTFEDKREED